MQFQTGGGCGLGWSQVVCVLDLTLSLISLNSSTVSIPSTSPSYVTFLDVDVRIENGHFHTSVHIKPTNSQQYLHYYSCHPTSTKCSIPYSLATRGRRICNHLQTYTSNLTRAFTFRGYPGPLIDKQLSRGLHHPNPSRPP